MFMMFLPTSSISSSLKTSLIFCQISPNQSLMAFHLSSMVFFTLSQISASVSRILSKISVALDLIAPHKSDEKDLIPFQICSQAVRIVERNPEIMDLIVFVIVDTIPLIASQIPLKKVLIPSQARSQSPVNTPTIKSIKPPNALRIFCRTPLTPDQKMKNALTAPCTNSAIVGAAISMNQSTNG